MDPHLAYDPYDLKVCHPYADRYVMKPKKAVLRALLDKVRERADASRGLSLRARELAEEYKANPGHINWCFTKLNHEGLCTQPGRHNEVTVHSDEPPEMVRYETGPYDPRKKFKYKTMEIYVIKTESHHKILYQLDLVGEHSTYTWISHLPKVNKITVWKEYKRIEPFMFMTLFME